VAALCGPLLSQRRDGRPSGKVKEVAALLKAIHAQEGGPHVFRKRLVLAVCTGWIGSAMMCSWRKQRCR
jgi:hypothetical protein